MLKTHKVPALDIIVKTKWTEKGKNRRFKTIVPLKKPDQENNQHTG